MAGGGIKQNNITIRGGADGITPEFMIEDDNLKVSYDNKISFTSLGKVVGNTGPQGPQGAPGPQGEPGNLGAETEKWTFVLEDGTTVEKFVCVKR